MDWLVDRIESNGGISIQPISLFRPPPDQPQYPNRASPSWRRCWWRPARPSTTTYVPSPPICLVVVCPWFDPFFWWGLVRSSITWTVDLPYLHHLLLPPPHTPNHPHTTHTHTKKNTALPVLPLRAVHGLRVRQLGRGRAPPPAGGRPGLPPAALRADVPPGEKGHRAQRGGGWLVDC